MLELKEYTRPLKGLSLSEITQQCLTRARKHLAENRLEYAQEEIQIALEISPSSSEALSLLFDFLEQYKMTDDDISKELYEGIRHNFLGDFSTAIDFLEEGLTRRTNLALHYTQLGIAYLKLAQYQRAEEYFTLSSTFEQRLSGLIILRVFTFIAQKKHQQAREAVLIEYQLNKYPIQCRYAEALVEKSLGNHENAIELLTQKDSTEPYSWLMDLELGILYEITGKHELASQHFLRSKEKRPEHFSIHYHLGVHLYSQGHITLALQALECSLMLNPRFSECIKTYANLLLAESEYSLLEKRMVSLANKASDCAEVYLQLGIAQIHLQHYSSAYDNLKRAQKFDPQNNNVVIWLARLLCNQQKITEAESLLEEFMNSHKHTLTNEVHYTFAQTKRYLGKLNDALGILNKICDKGPLEFWIHLETGIIFSLQNKLNLSIKKLNDARAHPVVARHAIMELAKLYELRKDYQKALLYHADNLIENHQHTF